MAKKRAVLYFVLLLAVFLIALDAVFLGNHPSGFAVAGEADCIVDEDCGEGEICEEGFCFYVGGDGDEWLGGEGESESEAESEWESKETYIDECNPDTFVPKCYAEKYLTSCKETDTKPYLHKVAIYCGADKTCEEMGGTAQCVGEKTSEGYNEKTLCVSDERKCVGNVAWICSEDEMRWEKENCDYKCENGYCMDAGCKPESKLQCLGNLLQICSSGEWTTMQICPYGCNKETLACNLEPFCSDSDGGTIPNIKGLTYGIDEENFLMTGKYTYTEEIDECGVREVNGETISCGCSIGETECIAPCDLLEYYCRGHFVRADILSCEYGCMDGACIPPENVLVSLIKGISVTMKTTAHAFFRFVGTQISCSLETENEDCMATEYCDDTTFTCQLYCGNGVLEYEEGEVCDKGIPGIIDPVLDGKKCTDPEFSDKNGNPFVRGNLKCFSNCLAFDTSGCRT